MQHAGPKYTLQAKERMIVVSSRSISPTLSNQSISLSLAFTEMIKPSTDIKYNLAWSYGDFLHDVPQRIGINEALDSAATALVDAHSYFCVTGTVSPTARALMKYSDALVKLRLCLDDPAKAQASETLCAVMLLMICQVCLDDTHAWSYPINQRIKTGVQRSHGRSLDWPLRGSGADSQGSTVL